MIHSGLTVLGVLGMSTTLIQNARDNCSNIQTMSGITSALTMMVQVGAFKNRVTSTLLACKILQLNSGSQSYLNWMKSQLR